MGITASMTRGSMARGNPRAAGLARGTMTRGAGDYLPSLARGVKRGRAMDTLGMQMAGNGGPLPSLVSGMGGFGAWPAHV